MKMYILTTGDYNEIVASFTTREKAEDEKARRGNYSDNEIDECEVDPEPTSVPEGFEKGNVYSISVYIKSGVIVNNYFYCTYCYRHPTECVIDESELTDSLFREKHITVKSPISRDHAIEVGLKHREKILK
jgi:hypothetical protein